MKVYVVLQDNTDFDEGYYLIDIFADKEAAELLASQHDGYVVEGREIVGVPK